MKSEMRKNELEILENEKNYTTKENFTLVGRINELGGSADGFTQNAAQIRQRKYVEGAID